MEFDQLFVMLTGWLVVAFIIIRHINKIRYNKRVEEYLGDTSKK